jgi:hypothetical protein
MTKRTKKGTQNMNPEDPLTEFEFNVMLARAMFKKTGNANLALKLLEGNPKGDTTPADLPGLVDVRPPDLAPRAAKKSGIKLSEKTCPKCGVTGSVPTLFGYKMHRGVQRVQSWCKSCRGNEPYLSGNDRRRRARK